MIRPETASDIPAIHKLTLEAFREAPHSDQTEHFIVDALRDAGALTVSLVAERGERIIGHIAISPVTISDGSHGWHGLGPVSVCPALQRQGIGSQLVRNALDNLRESGSSGSVVLGDPRFYSRFGFKPSTDLVLPDMPQEYFQVLHFDNLLPCGRVEFHRAFKTKG